MPTTIKQEFLEITAISKTLYFFDSILAKISIPINISKLNDASEWYYLKNNKNENIIGVLISMYYDSKEKSALSLLGDCSFIAGVNHLPSKANISCDILKTNNCNTNNLFLNIINRTGNVAGINNSVDNIKINAQSQLIENANSHNVNNKNSNSNINNNNNNNHKDSKKRNINDLSDKSNLRLDTTIIYNDYLKSPDNSLTNNLFSPFSCRFENDKINLNLTNINSKFFSNSNINNNNSIGNHINSTTNANGILNNFSALNNKNITNVNSHERNNFNNLLEISDNKLNTMFNSGEPMDDNFYSFVENKLEKILGNLKENYLNHNMDNNTINRSHNNLGKANHNLSKNECLSINEELSDLLNKLKQKNLFIKEESEKIKKAKDEIKKQKESKTNQLILI